MKYAVIDVSSCSVSLLVAEFGEKLNVLLTDRETLSVLHYAKGRTLTERGIEKIAEGIEKMKGIAANYGAEKCYVISTASVRNFLNYEEVEKRLNELCGVNLNLLDGEAEAYCDYIANTPCDLEENSLLIDVGGGSIELCNLTAKDGEGAVDFLDFGSVFLKRKFVRYTHPNEDEAKKIKRFVKNKLGNKSFASGVTFEAALLVGATSRAIYEAYCDYFNQKPAENAAVEYGKLKELRNYLITSSVRSMLIVKIAPERIDTFVTSAIALCAVLKYYGIEKATLSPCGVKEGYLTLVVKGEKEGKETPLVCGGNANE
ncbi:MAG: hypothetical protein ACI4QN_05620 [Candidatus Coproplasma sp.]